MFTGPQRASLDRYRAMSEYSWSLAVPSEIFGPDNIVSEVISSQITNTMAPAPAAPALSVVNSAAGPSRSSMPRLPRSTPCK